jgi:hypothetical protein
MAEKACGKHQSGGIRTIREESAHSRFKNGLHFNDNPMSKKPARLRAPGPQVIAKHWPLQGLDELQRLEEAGKRLELMALEVQTHSQTSDGARCQDQMA